MTVTGYVVRSNDYQWAKPYLFSLEAKEVAELMTVTSGKPHWIIRTEMDVMSNALVWFHDKELITDVRNISPMTEGFEAETVIEGRWYKVARLFPFEPWRIVSGENPVTKLDCPEDSFDSIGSSHPIPTTQDFGKEELE